MLKTPLKEDYHFVIKFEQSMFSKEEVNRICNKVRALLRNEGFFFEANTDSDKEQYKKTQVNSN